MQEAQLTARLDHPNILRVFDTGEVDGYYYIEMEYIEGQTLRALVSQRNRLGERETLKIGSQLVKALNYAHNVKIKPPAGETIKKRPCPKYDEYQIHCDFANWPAISSRVLT